MSDEATKATPCPHCGSENTKEEFDDGPHCEWEYAGRKCADCGILFDNN